MPEPAVLEKPAAVVTPPVVVPPVVTTPAATVTPPATPAADAKPGEPSLLEAAAPPPKPGEPLKPGEPVKTQGAPEKYTDFKLPEGMTADSAALEKAMPVFKKHGLSQEAAQEFVTLQAEHAKFTADTLIANAEKQRADQIDVWRKETQTALGSEWQKELSFAAKALDAFWPPEFRKMLTASGLGDHPLMSKGLVALGKAMSETKPGEGTRVEITDPAEDRNRKLFPSMYDASGKYIGGPK